MCSGNDRHKMGFSGPGAVNNIRQLAAMISQPQPLAGQMGPTPASQAPGFAAAPFNLGFNPSGIKTFTPPGGTPHPTSNPPPPPGPSTVPKWPPAPPPYVPTPTPPPGPGTPPPFVPPPAPPPNVNPAGRGPNGPGIVGMGPGFPTGTPGGPPPPPTPQSNPWANPTGSAEMNSRNIGAGQWWGQEFSGPGKGASPTWNVTSPTDYEVIFGGDLGRGINASIPGIGQVQNGQMIHLDPGTYQAILDASHAGGSSFMLNPWGGMGAPKGK